MPIVPPNKEEIMWNEKDEKSLQLAMNEAKHSTMACCRVAKLQKKKAMSVALEMTHKALERGEDE